MIGESGHGIINVFDIEFPDDINFRLNTDKIAWELGLKKLLVMSPKYSHRLQCAYFKGWIVEAYSTWTTYCLIIPALNWHIVLRKPWF